MLKTYDAERKDGKKKGISEIIQRVIEQDPTLDKPGIEDSVIQILEFLLTGQPKQKGDQDGLTKTVLDVISGTPFVYEYTYNQQDQLTSVYDPITDKIYSYAYDLKGNLVSKQDYYGDYSYSWDYKNQLIGATTPNQTIKYSYDSKDRRTSKVVILNGSEESQTTSYQYDNWSVLKETHETATSSFTIDYSYRDDNTPQAITIGDNTYYYLTDGHGDIRGVTDKEGTTLVKYSYDAWGNPRNVILSPQGEEPLGDPSSPTAPQDDVKMALQDDVANLNPYRYASYRYDSETGMYYLRARYYDPVTGRFLSQDPIAAQNLYPYVNNNPINAIDPSGMLGWLVKGYTGSNQVYVLQDALKQLYNRADGYVKSRAGGSALNVSRDGDFGSLTRNAVETFQRIFLGKSYVSGIVYSSTWNILLAENLAKYPYTGVSSPCRDNNGSFRVWEDSKNYLKGRFGIFGGSDCYYSIKWLGYIGYKQAENQYGSGAFKGWRSVCEFSEYNGNFYAPGYPYIPWDRWCKWRGGKGSFPNIYSDYPRICSEVLPMDNISSWRLRYYKNEVVYNLGYKQFSLIILSTLLRWWP